MGWFWIGVLVAPAIWFAAIYVFALFSPGAHVWVKINDREWRR